MLLRLVYQLLQLFIVEGEPFVIKDSPYPEFEDVAVKISPYMLSRDVIDSIMDWNLAYEKPINDLDSSELRERAISIVQDYLCDMLMNA